jgi:hypothetical protein
MRHLKRMVVGVAAAVAALATIAPGAFAQPAPGYEQFAGCPDDPDVVACLRSETNSGSIQMGSKTVPINKQIVLSGGVLSDFSTIVFNSQGGLNAPPLKVPGGLVGLTGLPEVIIDAITLGANQVFAKTELVGTPKSVGILSLTLPVRVKLQNPFLSPNCAIGSAANPLVLDLTTGTTNPPPPNKPISGSLGPQGPDPTNPLILLAADNTYVDNAFAAPAATGCDLTGLGLIDGLVNLTSGLPSPAGSNTAIMSDTDVRLAGPEEVYP